MSECYSMMYTYRKISGFFSFQSNYKKEKKKGKNEINETNEKKKTKKKKKKNINYEVRDLCVWEYNIWTEG